MSTQTTTSPRCAGQLLGSYKVITRPLSIRRVPPPLFHRALAKGQSLATSRDQTRRVKIICHPQASLSDVLISVARGVPGLRNYWTGQKPCSLNEGHWLVTDICCQPAATPAGLRVARVRIQADWRWEYKMYYNRFNRSGVPSKLQKQSKNQIWCRYLSAI